MNTKSRAALYRSVKKRAYGQDKVAEEALKVLATFPGQADETVRVYAELLRKKTKLPFDIRQPILSGVKKIYPPSANKPLVNTFKEWIKNGFEAETVKSLLALVETKKEGTKGKKKSS